MAFEENWANDYVTTLAGSGQVMDATTSLSCVVSSAAGAPATPFRLKIITGGVPEYILVTTVAGTTFSWPGMGNRGLGGTSAAAHNGGDTCGCPITAEGLTLGLVRQLLAGASGNLTTSPASGQGVVTADILPNPVFTGLVTGAGLRDSRGMAGANIGGVHLGSVVLGAGTTAFTIPNPTLWNSLRFSLRDGYTPSQAGSDNIALRMNGDTAANYQVMELTSTNSAAFAGGFPAVATSAYLWPIPGTTVGVTFNGSGWLEIVGGNSANYKGLMFQGRYGGAATNAMRIGWGYWQNAALLTSISFLSLTGPGTNTLNGTVEVYGYQ